MSRKFAYSPSSFTFCVFYVRTSLCPVSKNFELIGPGLLESSDWIGTECEVYLLSHSSLFLYFFLCFFPSNIEGKGQEKKTSKQNYQNPTHNATNRNGKKEKSHKQER